MILEQSVAQAPSGPSYQPSKHDAALDRRIETAAFSYLRLDISHDPHSGGQVVTHHIEVHGPRRPKYMLFSHFKPEGEHAEEGAYTKMAADTTSDSTTWTPGTVLSISQTFRLPPGRYEVRVGFIARSTRERLPLPGYKNNVLPVGSVTILDSPLPLLRRPADLVPATQQRLLETILGLDPVPGNQGDHLTACFGQAPQFGHVLEFGVAGGKSINHLASLAPHRTIWGFDSFEGLPEDWVRSEVKTRKAGTFSQGGLLPIVRENVTLVKGLIQETLPTWLSKTPGNVGFVHIDVDLYSAAKFVLDALNERFVPSTVIVLDDVAVWDALRDGHSGGYDAWRDGEWRALTEWLAQSGRQVAVTSRGTTSTLGVRVLA